MSDTYCYLHLRGEGRDHTELKKVLARVAGAWRQAEISIWGTWQGLFGLASNELIIVAAAAGERPESDFTASLAAEPVSIRDSLLLTPTVRPEGRGPCVTPGLYVFRFFDVATKDVAEVASLSRQAWETFESSDDYRSEPQALFREVDESAELGRMLLVTWYDGLESWQTSRAPHPDATENFKRRRDLTQGTMAIATRLTELF